MDFIGDLWRTIKRGKVWKGEIKNRAKDGSCYWVDATSVPSLNEDGQPRQFVTIRADITKLKEAESASLKQAAIVEFSKDAIIGKDLDGTMASWNSGAEIMFGYSAREMVGRSILDLIPPDGHAEEQDILEQIRRGRSVQHLETVRRAKDGRLIHVSVTCSPIRDARGKIIGASKSARDITERVQAEAVPLLLHAIPFNSINSEGIFNDYLSSRPKAAIPQARDRTPKGPAAGIAPTPSGCTDIAMICGLGLGRGEQNMKDNVNGIA